MTTLPSDPSGADPAGADPSGATTPEAAVLEEASEVMETVVEAQAVDLDVLDVPRRLLLVHAHPDDESIGNGATMARYAAGGAHVTLVTCTLGEEGEVLVPELAHLAADRDDALGQRRVEELATAMEALGVTDSRFLGGPGRYRDSGMMGTPTNSRADCFWRADLDEAAGLLVDVLRDVRPQVVVTYDEQGGYGHPDHIQAHRVTVRAVELAADPGYAGGADAPAREPWRVSKLYYTAVPESALRDGLRRLRESGAAAAFEGMDPDGELPPFAVPDDAITTQVDAEDWAEAKAAAMRAHATQIAVDGPFFALSNNVGQPLWAVEHYRLAQGRLGPVAADGREHDLFAGVD